MARSKSGVGEALAWVGVAGLAVWGLSSVLAPPAPRSRGRLLSNDEVDRLVGRLYRRAARHFPVPAPPLVATDGVPNAASDGHSVLYNRQFVRGVLARYCDDRSCGFSVMLGIMAHELAHHVYQDARSPGHPHAEELRADYAAGWVLGSEGVSPRDFARVLGELSPADTATHPGGRRRRAAIDRGYRAVVAAYA